MRAKTPVHVEWLAQLAAEPEQEGGALTLKGERGQVRLKTLGGGGGFEPRKPTSIHVDVPPQKLHTYAARTDGAAVNFAVLIQPGFSRDVLPPLTVETREARSGGANYLVRGDGWTDHVLACSDAEQMEATIPGTGAAATANAHLLALRADAKGARSALAVRAVAFKLPGVVEVRSAIPAEIGAQKTPDGSWVLDADRDVLKEIWLADGFTLETLDAPGANAFRWLLLARGGNRQAAAEWLAARLVFRERSPVVVRAPAAQGPLPASVAVSFLAAAFQGQRDGAAEVVEGKPGGTAVKTLRGFGNEAARHAVDWQFSVAQAGQYRLLVRYATDLPEVKLAALLDGALPAQEFANVTLPGTGGWSIHEDNWKTVPLCDAAGKPLVFHLSAGKHELRLANPTGALALDRFEFRGTGR